MQFHDKTKVTMAGESNKGVMGPYEGDEYSYDRVERRRSYWGVRVQWGGGDEVMCRILR